MVADECLDTWVLVVDDVAAPVGSYFPHRLETAVGTLIRITFTPFI